MYNPVQNIRLTGVGETVKLKNKFEKPGNNLESTLKSQSIKEMMNLIPVVIARPLVPPAGSNFDLMNPGVGVKIAEGKKVKHTEVLFEDLVGKTSKARYLDIQEKVGGF